MINRKDLFDFMLRRIKHTAGATGDALPQAFGKWFSKMYFGERANVEIWDASGDGKVDLLVAVQTGNAVTYKILNTKFTSEYDRASPVAFYDEITRYWQAFENRSNRPAYLNAVREELRPKFRRLFKLYDEGLAKLYFVTDHRINSKQFSTVTGYDVEILHLDDVLQYVAEHIEGAMPETEPLMLTGISNVLTPPTNESEVPTSIVFARLIDFIHYMEVDPFDLLFARNVRLWLGRDTEANRAIEETFHHAPKEFAYSNNGITILCKRHTHDPGKQELRLENPRVVNGSQTLHSVRNSDNPSKLARVMVRIIEVPHAERNDLPAQVEKRKDIIHKISIRSNLQNPIKRWNLVANDDFQNEVARYFWDKKLYYERRQGEWKYRKAELESIGIRKGPDIRWMTQLISSYHVNDRGLGPAVAQAKLNSLFEEEPYAVIRSTSPALAYQLYTFGEIIEQTLKKLVAKRRYIRNVRGYVDLCAFAVVTRGFREAGVQFGKENLNEPLEELLASPTGGWESGVKAVVDVIVADFDRAASTMLRAEGKDLTAANYFKSTKLIGALMSQPLPTTLRTLFKTLS